MTIKTKIKKIAKNSKGFALIELLVVISIIGMLSSIILVSVYQTRGKGVDARKQADLKQIGTALSLFYQEKGRMPLNYNKGGCSRTDCLGFSPDGGGWFGACDGFPPNDDGTMNMPIAYNASMQELVDANLLASIPHSPGGAPYCYFDYGAGGPLGGLMVTILTNTPPTTVGVSPSCRPYPPSASWCDQSNTQQYCICNSY